MFNLSLNVNIKADLRSLRSQSLNETGSIKEQDSKIAYYNFYKDSVEGIIQFYQHIIIAVILLLII